MYSSLQETEQLDLSNGSDQVGTVRGFSPFQQGIGIRLLAYIVLFSTVVTLISTVMQLYFDYRRDVGAIEQRMMEIERTLLDSLSESLWNVDTAQMRLQLDGLIRLPDMQSVELREAGEVDAPLVLRAGQTGNGAKISRTFPLYHGVGNARKVIGNLTVDASLTTVYSRLLDTAVFILLSQGVKTFLVSLFTLYLVYRLVTRHLIAIASYLDRFDLRQPGGKLALDRHKPRSADELDRQVVVEVQPDVSVQGDRRLLRVVLENLLDNAWKYSRKAEKPVISFGSTLDAGGKVFFVRDNGVGFDMANVNRLFTPFNRLHKPEEFEGSGIGLATVQRILARHGGRVWATAAPNRGATFHFTCWEGKSADEQP